MEMVTHSPEETQALAKLLANYLTLGQVIRLEGPLGSGKTTFTQGLGRALGIKRAIKSPTYTIVKNYPLEQGEFIHIDAYRLEEGGAETVDIDMFMHPQAITLIEWAQFIEAYLPERYLSINFVLQDEFQDRQIQFEMVNGREEDIEHLNQFATAWQRGIHHDN